MAELVVKNLERIRREIAKKFTEVAIPIIMERALENSKQYILDEIIESLHRTKMWEGLSQSTPFNSPQDLRALMGLSDDVADAAMLEIDGIIRNSLEIVSVQGRYKGRFAGISQSTQISVGLRESGLRKRLLASHYGSYVSYPSGEEIPWIKWLLDGAAVEAELVFLIDRPTISVGDSRSGRAIMDVDGDPTAYWVFNKEDFTDSENFITDIVEDEQLVERIKKVLSREIRKETKAFSGIL